jgi:hypothetical protein
LLAEAGSGKTREMQEHKERLVKDGKYAFFIAIEQLDSEDLPDILSRQAGESERFEAWVGSDETATFFLDSVDELKLIHGKLEKALGRLNKAVKDYQQRTQIIISCRPTDWRPIEDLETFERIFPPLSKEKEIIKTEDDIFLEPFKKDKSSVDEDGDDDKDDGKAGKDKVRIVVLLPLNEEQVKTFSHALGVSDVDAFIKQISFHDAWSFTKRPLDLQELVTFWRNSGKIGTSLEQHQMHIGFTLQENPDRRDGGVLSAQRCIEGVERLALALVLTQKRTILSPEHTVGKKIDPSAMEANKILPDWRGEEVAALLRRAIFDPATYGRIRFHHRSIQEYLAAQYLLKLRSRGMPVKELHRLLFCEKYGEKIVIPSMRPIAAWVALKDPGVLNEILEREPEVLVLFGDPASLSKEVKVKLIKNYVDAYGEGGWRGLDMPITQLRKLATPDLEDCIRECWAEAYTNEEISEILLKIIWLGDISNCADIASDTLMDPEQSPYARIAAARALSSFNRIDLLKKVFKNILEVRKNWPDKVIHSTIDDFFPKVITTTDVIKLIKEVPETNRTTGGFGWEIFQLAAEISPLSEPAISLRDKLAELIKGSPATGSSWHEPKSKYSYLCPALARLCLQQIDAGLQDAALYKAATISVRYNTDRTLGREETNKLKSHMAKMSLPLQEEVFWFEHDTLSYLRKENQNAHTILYESVIGNAEDIDPTWLLKTLQESADTSRKKVSFDVLVWIWQVTGRKPDLLESIKQAVKAIPDLAQELSTVAKPVKPSPQYEKMMRQAKIREAKRKAKDAEVAKSWTDWKVEIQKSPEGAFSEKKLSGTLATISRWLSFRREGSYSIAQKNWPDVRRALGDKVADLFETQLRLLWKSIDPPVYSKRKLEDHNIIHWNTVYALTGLDIERTSNKDWASRLTPQEAELAAKWATLEFNQEWLDILIEHHSETVKKVFTEELSAELNRDPRPEHYRMLDMAVNGSKLLKSLVAPYLKTILFEFTEKKNAEKPINIAITKSLGRMLWVIYDGGLLDKKLEAFCADSFMANPKSELSPMWLRGLAAVNLDEGVNLMAKAVEGLIATEKEVHGVRWFAGVFGERDHNDRISIDLKSRNISSLYKLVILAYECVARTKDVVHEGAFSPGVRDNAETARNRTFNAIVESTGPEAYKAMVDMAGQSVFRDTADRLRLLARERAAKDSEISALPIDQFSSFETLHGKPPVNNEELLQVVLDRLDDISHDIHNYDFSDIATLQKIKDETEVQNNLAAKLEAMQRNHYTVSREGEVFDAKKPDIRLAATGFAGKAAIEIKIGDSWSVKQLEEAVEGQLTEQYLRHKNCTVGVLLVTYAGRKGFEDPDTGKVISFEDVMARLVKQATALELKEQGRVNIKIYPIDLRTPPKDG